MYLKCNNIEFLVYNRRKQYFLLKYILENNIKHWEELNLEEINNLFIKSNKKFEFVDIVSWHSLPYFNNWLVGFTAAASASFAFVFYSYICYASNAIVKIRTKLTFPCWWAKANLLLAASQRQEAIRSQALEPLLWPGLSPQRQEANVLAGRIPSRRPTPKEGSFHIKARGTAHFSIVQSGIENSQIIKAIHYFIKGPDSLNHQIKPENSKVYRISFSSKKDLNFIRIFFDNNLLGLKKLQFDNWKSYIISKMNDSAPNVILPKVSNNNINETRIK
jgi:hypothetical protein